MIDSFLSNDAFRNYLEKCNRLTQSTVGNAFRITFPCYINMQDQMTENLFKLKFIFSTKFRPKTKYIVRAVFDKNIKVSDFGLIWWPFREYLNINNFFQKPGSVTFLPLQSPNFMQKIKKILRVVSEKTALPTNQPIITNNTDLIGPCSRRSNKFTKQIDFYFSWT